MSITERMGEQLSDWQNELEKLDFELKDSSQEKVFEFLNRRENICTPGFILRRQIQKEFPKLIEESAVKAGVAIYADLLVSGNVDWDTQLIECLSKKLEETVFEQYGKYPPNIEWKQWKNYLSDKSRCQRDTAIKLIFALNMDELTAAKFLLSSGRELLNWRNSFDYSCKVCLTYHFKYTDAENLFNEFERRRDKNQFIDETQEQANSDFTRKIKNETEQFSKNDKILFEDLKELILETMLKYQKDFRLHRNESGYSFQNLERFKILLKYLTLLYPTFNAFVGKDGLNNVEIEKKADGTPKFPKHLIISMLESQEIDLPEYAELAKYGGPELEARGLNKRLYDNIPFTRNILIPLRSLEKNIRAILRAIKNPENAIDINRDAVLFLTYFLITGWIFAEEEKKEQILENLQDDIDEFEAGSSSSEMVQILEEVLYGLGSIEDNKNLSVDFYISLINRILTPFDFIGCYAPFVLDRFILICLMSLKYFDEEYLMQLVIDESYRLSLKLMNQKEVGKNGGI